MSDWQFDHVNHAMKWATEVLRHRRFPKINPMYQEIVSKQDKAHQESRYWHGEYGNLPTDPDERVSLALKVNDAANRLMKDEQVLLQLYYWGDYASPKRLAAAEKIQRSCEQKGRRVRLSYRYSYRQLASILGVAHTTAARRVEAALKSMEDMLHQEGLLITHEARRKRA